MFGRRSQSDFENEIRSHLQLEIDRLKALGMSEADAKRAARRTFGNIGVVEDSFYHAQRFAWIDSAVRDVRQASRSLLRTPGFFIAAVVTLALAMGATAGMFGVVNTVILEPLPLPNADRLVYVRGTAPDTDMPERFDLGSDFYLQYKEKSKLIDGIFMFGGGTATLRTVDRVERIQMAWPTNDMYATVGVRPQLGRLPVSEDGTGVAVISDQLWSSWFGRDSSVIGRSYYISDGMKRIIGIMPPEFRFPFDDTMLWLAREVTLQQVRPGGTGARIIARVKEGVSREALATELTRLSKELPARFAGPANYAHLIAHHQALIQPVLDRMVSSRTRTSLWVLLGAVAVVLLIACANVTSLFLVRAESRRRQLTVRAALGASRMQLVRHQMAEAVAVALAAGALAVALSAMTLPLFLRAAPQGIPRLSQAGLDFPTIGAAFALVLFVALACGAVPAFRASSANFAELRDGGRGATVRRSWGRDLLVAGQAALALVLLIGSTLLLQSVTRLRHVDPGYHTTDLYTFQYAPVQPHLNDGPSFGRLHVHVMRRLGALPGVTGAGIVNSIPLDEETDNVRVLTAEMGSDAGGAPMRMNNSAGDYFRVMGIALLQGRIFSDDEAVTPNANVIVSRSAAAILWPDQNPLGRRIRPRLNSQDTIAFTVVGVVQDVKQEDLRDAGEAVIYFPLTGPTPTIWRLPSPAFVLKSSRGESLKQDVRTLMREVAPEAPVYREFTMESLVERSMVHLSFTTLTLSVLSALALLLGAIGLYGVLSYLVANRTREIGVRMALGASSTRVRRQVVSHGARVVLGGSALGVVVAVASTRLLGTLLYDVQAADPLVFTAMSVVMVAVGLLASYVPARRASGVDPIVALRSD